MRTRILTIVLLLLATLAVQAENYGINVGGVEVSSSNYNNVTGGYIGSGTVTYNRSTNTLTLNNVSITNTSDGKYALHNRSCAGLKVVVQGTCYFNTKAHAIHFDKGGTITIASGGKLIANQSTTTSDVTGAIYIKDDRLIFNGPGQLSVLSNRCGIIGTGASSSSGIWFDEGITAIIQGSRSDVMNLNYITQFQGCTVVYKATNDYNNPNVQNVSYMLFNGKTEIVQPWYASFSETKKSIVNGSNGDIYDTDIYVHSNYAVVIKFNTFPDYNFRQYLLSLVPKGYFTDGELQSLVSLDVSGKNIHDLTGIRLLRYVQILKCYNNQLTSLDVSYMPLVYLDCDNNRISSLDVSDRSDLATLKCRNNGLTSLDVSGTALTTLDCSSNNLMNIRGLPSSLQTLDCHSNSFTSFSYTSMRAMKSLNISSCYSLTSLTCCNNNLTDLNVSGNTALKWLYCYGNPDLASITGFADCKALCQIYCYDCALTNLSSVNNMTDLEILKCSNNKLTSLTVTNKSKLTSLECSLNTNLTTATVTGNSKLSSLDFYYCIGLSDLDCSSNVALTMLRIESCTALTQLYCYDDHNLASISGLGDCTAMQWLSCFGCALTDLSAVNSMNNIEFLNCSSNQLTSLQVTNKSKLTNIYCHYNPQLRTITATGNPLLNSLTCMENSQLWKLDCYANALPSVDVTGCSNLKELRCYDNPALARIDGLADCTLLQKLYCYNSALTSLNGINNMADLDYLNCHDTHLTALGLTSKNRLTTVLCYNNPNMTELTLTGCGNLTNIATQNCPSLKTLNVTGNTALKTFSCYDNSSLASITGLSDCTALTHLYCYNCAITNLDGCNSMSNLTELYCYNNKITSLTLTNKSKLTRIDAYNNTSLTTATINSNSALTALNINGCTALTSLTCSGNNKLTSLVVSTLTNLIYFVCQGNQLTSLNVTNSPRLQTLYCDDNKLTSLNVSGMTSLTRIQCFDNQLTSLNVQGCSALYVLDCEDNNLTSLSVQGCTALRYLNCFLNRITGDGMTTLVGSLPMCTSSDPGTMTVQWYYGEGNVIDAAQCATARAKYWNPRRHDGSNYVDIVFESTRGDADGDGNVGIADVTAVIDYMLSGDASDIDLQAANVDGDATVGIADVTALNDYLLSGTWDDEPSNVHEWVDLGLPSGTLWATCNVGANSPEGYGDYFAWGEVEPKENYSWSTYKWCIPDGSGEYSALTKYCTKSSQGTVDNKTELDPEDDAAYVNWGENWRMPTMDQIHELHENCSWTWTTLNGVDGWMATGPSGATLFLPAAGLYWNDSFYSGDFGHYWSRTLNENNPESAIFLSFDSVSVEWSTFYRRFYGRSVRPVRVAQ